MNTAVPVAVPTPPHMVSISQLRQSVIHAGALFARYPVRWLLTTVLMAVAIEIPILVPHVGLALKIAASGMLGAQVMGMFQAADGGEKPRPWRVLSGFARPLGVTAPLVAGVWLPLSIALLWTLFHDGRQVAATFLSQPGAMSPEAQLHFKMVLFVAAMPVTFVAAAVSIGRLRGISALIRAVVAAVRNPLLVLLLSGGAIGVEAAIERLFHYLPGAFGIALGTLLTLLIITVMAAWSYALGALVFATGTPPEVAASPDPR
ncbi:MAG: hypothetical protein WAZ48_03795 [Lysobacteraceae bacterium]